MSLATVPDVADRLGREIEPRERDLAAVLLDDAERILTRRVPTLPERAQHDEGFAATATMIEATMVLRVLRNPDGYRQESEGGYSYTVDTRAASGFLTVLDDEWDMLGVSGGAFTIRPHLGTAAGMWWNQPPWQLQYGDPSAYGWR